MKYSVRCRFDDRRFGPSGRTLEVEASNIPAAIAKGSREFWKSLNRKQHFDAGRGLRVEASRVREVKA